MDRKQIAHVMRTRHHLPVNVRPCAVLVGSGWIGASIVPNGKRPMVSPTIPGRDEQMLFVLAVFLTFGLAYMAWALVCKGRAMELCEDIADLFKRELGVKVR